MTDAHAATLDIEHALRARIAADHPLADQLRDQLLILERIEAYLAEPTEDDEAIDRIDRRIARHERDALRAVLADWLTVIDRRDALAGRTDPPVLNVRDFGAVGDGEADDGPSLRRAIAALGEAGPGAVLRWPTGKYRVGDLDEAHRRYALVCRGLRDVTLDAEPGTRIVAEPVGGVLLIDDCENLTVRGLDLAHDPSPCTQGVVERVRQADTDHGDAEAEAATWEIDWRLDSGHRPPDEEPFIRLDRLNAGLYDPRTGQPLSGHASLSIRQVHRLDADRFRLTAAARGDAAREAFGPGARLGIRSRNVPGGRCALWVEDSRFCTFENFEVRDAYHFAVLATHTTGCVFRHIAVGGGPAADGALRLCSVNADGFHAKSNRHGPRIENCRVLNTPDDCANLYSRTPSAARRLGPRTLLLDSVWDDADRWTGDFADGAEASDKWGWRPDRRAFREGDLLMLIDPNTGRADLIAQVRRAFAATWHDRRAVAVELDADLPAHLRTRQSLGDDRPVPHGAHFLHWAETHAGTPVEHFVVNLATKSDGFVIRGNHMGRNTVAGIKMKASNGLIADNRFESHGWCCLTLLNNLKWQEAFAPRNLRITGNHFENRFGVHAACSYPVAVDPRFSPPWIRGIDLRDNRFSAGPDGWAIQIDHARRCAFNV